MKSSFLNYFLCQIYVKKNWYQNNIVTYWKKGYIIQKANQVSIWSDLLRFRNTSSLAWCFWENIKFPQACGSMMWKCIVIYRRNKLINAGKYVMELSVTRFGHLPLWYKPYDENILLRINNWINNFSKFFDGDAIIATKRSAVFKQYCFYKQNFNIGLFVILFRTKMATPSLLRLTQLKELAGL